jgi:O-antigen ligase
MEKENILIKTYQVLVVCLAMALLTTVAGTNILVLLMLLLSPFAWLRYSADKVDRAHVIQMWTVISIFCVWSMLPNWLAGYSIVDVMKALLHDMRTFMFIVVLWAVFARDVISRIALWALLSVTVILATANLVLTVSGYLSPGEYFWPTAPHLYGQILVGFFFLLAQLFIVRPELSWRVLLPILLLLLSLFFASERRTGYLQLAGGFVVWTALNHKRLLVGRYRWWFIFGALLAFVAALASPIVQRRMAQVGIEIQDFLLQTPEQRTATKNETAVGIRMQYYLSVWELIKQNNFLLGVGSIDFIDLFWRVNQKMGGTEKTLFSNPHNEYLYTLATKGVVGLVMYLAIFAQACRIAWGKSDEVQRIGLLVFVFLFMLSITTNSMMIDMEEGHFTMLILLIFLAPNSLELANSKPNVIESI